MKTSVFRNSFKMECISNKIFAEKNFFAEKTSDDLKNFLLKIFFCWTKSFAKKNFLLKKIL